MFDDLHPTLLLFRVYGFGKKIHLCCLGEQRVLINEMGEKGKAGGNGAGGGQIMFNIRNTVFNIKTPLSQEHFLLGDIFSI